MSTKTIAFLGKGGSGKSILSALTARLLIGDGRLLIGDGRHVIDAGRHVIDAGRRPLLIDADPAMGLATALGVQGYKTIGEARAEILRQAQIAKGEEAARLSEIIDYLLLEALVEAPDHALLVMGHTDTVGCYCSVNNLLRETLGTLAAQFGTVIIDAEAGVEQINREVTRSVTHAIILTDNSLRGARTALLAKTKVDRSPGMNPDLTGVLFNRVEAPDPELVCLLEDGGLRVLGTIPPDPVIAERDRRGLPALEMPAGSVALIALREMLVKEGILSV